MANKDDNLGAFYMGRTRIRPSRPKRNLPPGILTVAVLLVFVGIIWYAYPDRDSGYSDIDIPVVEADIESVKEIPTEDGGMEIPHQDSTIFEKMDKVSSVQDSSSFVKDVEKDEKVKLLPKEEAAMDKKVILESKGVLNGFAPEPRTAPDNRHVEKIEIMDSKAERLQALSASQAKKPADKKRVAIKDVKKTAVTKKSKKDILPGAVMDTYVQLGSYREKAAAEKDWWRFKKKYSKILGDLDYRIKEVDLKSKGIYHRLQAGKLTKEQAKSVCAQINSQKSRSCIVVR